MVHVIVILFGQTLIGQYILLQHTLIAFGAVETA